MYFSMNSYDWSQSSYIPAPQIGLNTGPPKTLDDFTTPPFPPPPYPLQDCTDEVESIAHQRSDAIETHCDVIRPKNLIWDPSNLKELGPLKFVGVYNLPQAFWPASLKDRVKNLGSDVDGTNRADDSINIKNPSSFVPYDTTDLFKNFDFLTPSHHANDNISDTSGLSVDEYHGQTEIAAVTEQREDKHELSLSPGVMEAAATDSEELLSYFTGSRKRKRAIYSGNEFSPAAAERFEMPDDFELSEPPHSKPRLDSCESVEDVLSLCHGSDVDGTNRADDSISLKNPSSFVPYDTTDLFEDIYFFLTPSHHAIENILDTSGLSVDEYHGQTEIAAVTERGEDKHELSLSPGVMEAAATDSEELLSYFTGSRKRKRAIYSGNEFSPAAADRFEMPDDFELSEPPHSKPRLDSCERVEDVEDLYHYLFSDESTAFYD